MGMENLTPLWLLKYLPNMLACHVTILHGAEGPSNTITCAEASGLLSIGESMRVIQRDAADLCFSGGAESKINVMGLLRMDLAGRVAHTGDSDDGVSFVRPYEHRKGPGPGRVNSGLLGEGGGIAILEELTAAVSRGARIYAEVAGFGAGHSDPATEAEDHDEGYRYAVEGALEDAGIGPEAIDAIVPLACGVGSMDRREAGALRDVFGDRLPRIPIVTTSPNIGNCMAGVGSLLMLVGARCLAEQRLPARLHGGVSSPELLAGRSDTQEAALEYVLVSSGALGGQNAALVLRRVPNVV
jgi:3-oxoacyl-[acyl-carrier-protein] synthase II